MLPEDRLARVHVSHSRDEVNPNPLRAGGRVLLQCGSELQRTIDRLAQEADLLALRKAYAAVLLKWRGHRLPSLAELEAQP